MVRGWKDISQPCQRGLVLGWVHCQVSVLWLDALAWCCGGEAASTNPLPSCSSTLGALGHNNVPSAQKEGAMVLWQLGAFPLCCFGCSCSIVE